MKIYFLELSIEEENIYIDNRANDIDIIGVPDKNNENDIIRIKYVISDNYKQVYIPNIGIPQTLKYNGFGKKMISIVYTFAKQYNYELFIVQKVDSFYEKMCKRGALPCEEPDMVQIIDTTNLQG